jgi:hypothetical protein
MPATFTYTAPVFVTNHSQGDVMKRETTGLAMLLAAAVLVTGCSYVQETTEGQGVRVVSTADVGQCTDLGKVTVSVVKMGRGEQFVRDDLIRLARNKAANSGADTIAAAGEPLNGEQVFNMYRCIKR